MEGINEDPKLKLIARCVDELLSQGGFIAESQMSELRERGVSAEALLDAFAAQGYLLHGSVSHQNILLPNEGDDGRDETKRQVGVYATNLSEIALLKATVSRSKLNELYDSITGGWVVHEPPVANTLPKVSIYSTQSILPAMVNGHVYILKVDSFKEIDNGEYISKEAVQPIITLPILASDFTSEVLPYEPE